MTSGLLLGQNQCMYFQLRTCKLPPRGTFIQSMLFQGYRNLSMGFYPVRTALRGNHKSLFDGLRTHRAAEHLEIIKISNISLSNNSQVYPINCHPFSPCRSPARVRCGIFDPRHSRTIHTNRPNPCP